VSGSGRATGTRRGWRQLAAAAGLVLAALTVLAVGTALRPPTFIGQPVAAPVAAAPAVSDCVTVLSRTGLRRAAQATVATCGPDAVVVGEVAALLAPADRLDGPLRAVATSRCRQLTASYPGRLDPVVNGPGSFSLTWASAVTTGIEVIGPNRRQRAAGQTWRACVVTAPGGAGYRGRLGGSLTGGGLPAPFGACYRSFAPSDDARVPCISPHRLELLATAVTRRTPLPAIDSSCRSYAARALRSADLTRAGALAVQVFSPTSSPFGLSTCAIRFADGRARSGSVIGLGSAPLPSR